MPMDWRMAVYVEWTCLWCKWYAGRPLVCQKVLARRSSGYLFALHETASLQITARDNQLTGAQPITPQTLHNHQPRKTRSWREQGARRSCLTSPRPVHVQRGDVKRNNSEMCYCPFQDREGPAGRNKRGWMGVSHCQTCASVELGDATLTIHHRISLRSAFITGPGCRAMSPLGLIHGQGFWASPPVAGGAA